MSKIKFHKIMQTVISRNWKWKKISISMKTIGKYFKKKRWEFTSEAPNRLGPI